MSVLFKNLPTDAWMHVHSFLWDIESIGATQVCQGTASEMRRDPRILHHITDGWWTTRYLKPAVMPYAITWTSMAHVKFSELAKRVPALEKIVFQEENGFDVSDIEKLTQLRMISVQNCSDGILPLLERLPQSVQILQLCGYNLPNNEMWEAIVKLQKLTTLSLLVTSGIDLQHISALENCKNLRCLTLRASAAQMSRHLIPLLRSLPKLTDLTLQPFSWYGQGFQCGSMIGEIATACPNLEALWMDPTDIDSNAIKKLPQVSILTFPVRFYSEYAKDLLEYIGSNQKLVQLNIVQDSRFAEESEDLSQKAKKVNSALCVKLVNDLNCQTQSIDSLFYEISSRTLPHNPYIR